LLLRISVAKDSCTSPAPAITSDRRVRQVVTTVAPASSARAGIDHFIA